MVERMKRRVALSRTVAVDLQMLPSKLMASRRIKWVWLGSFHW